MLSDPASISEETLDIQADCVRRTRFNSRKVSGGGTLLGDLAQLLCKIRLLWGERDNSKFRPAELLIGEIREAVGGTLDLHRIPRAGHWSAYENAPEVNRLMLELDRKSTRLNSSHVRISYAVFCLKKKKKHKAAHQLLKKKHKQIKNNI